MSPETDTFEHGIGVLQHGNKHTSDIQVSDPVTVNGVLIPEDTIVEGGQRVRHYFPPEALRMAEQVIQEQINEETVHLVKNFHEIEGQAPADDIIGELRGVRYSEGIGLLFEGEVADQDIAEKVANGYLSVSPSILRSLGEFDSQREARPVETVAGLRDAAIVGRGQPGADIELGPNPSVGTLAQDALSRAFDGELDALQVSEPDFTGYSEASWDTPTLEDTFGGDMEAARNSATWIEDDGEDFGDLSLFVLNGDAELNVNALDSAWRLAPQTDGPTEDDVERLRSMYEDMAEEANDAGAITDTEFDDVWQDRVADQDTQSDDRESASTDSQEQTDRQTRSTDTMSEEETLDEAERQLLAAVDNPERAIDVLRRYQGCEEPVIKEQNEIDNLESDVREAKEAFAAVLAEDSRMSKEGLMKSEMDALTEPFRNEDGDIEPDTLRQEPETGDVTEENTSEDTGFDVNDIGLNEKQELGTLEKKRTVMENRGMTNRAEEIKQEMTELVGAPDYDTLEREVL